MDSDIRRVLESAADRVEHPGPRVARWQAGVPRLLARATREQRGVARSHPLPAPLLRLLANMPATRTPAFVVTLASLLVAATVLGAGVATFAMRSTTGPLVALRYSSHRTTSHKPGAQAVVVVATSSPCPPDERRFDDAVAGFHLCLPTQARSIDYSATLRGAEVISVTGFGDESLPPPSLRHDSTSPTAPITISATYQTMAEMEADQGLTQPTSILVAGQPAHEFFVSDPGSPVPTARIVLVERGDRLYRIEQSQPSGTLTVEFEEMLRTFAFQALPYWADPELQLTRGLG
ncbi:MAG: hypothetical protein ACYDGR_12060 [Candidatus Dormibacteria bacterium]